MDAKRIALLKKHLAADTSPNVRLACVDFCELVTGSKIDDEGLQKAAKSMQGHVGFVAVDRAKAAEMLAAVSGQPGKASATQNDESKVKS